jgi:hypothetical protein
MNQETITTTRAAYEHELKKAYENGYQKGLYDGIISACRNSAPGKRMVAAGNENGFTHVDLTAFDEDDTAVLGILSGPTRYDEQEQQDHDNTYEALQNGARYGG